MSQRPLVDLPDLPRRTFLVSAGATACAFGLAACTHTNAARVIGAPMASGAIVLRLSEQPELATVGGAVKLKPPGYDDTILLWRSGANEYSATSIVCTHMGCEVEVADGGRSLACPCHGSQYAADGTVTHGPAGRALRRYRAEANDTQLVVRPA
jgi:cytochrome b6-f complex iron-sulfur subunit